MKSVKMFGKSVPILAILIASMLAIGASASLLTYYGSITKEVTVTQAVLLDGFDYTVPIVEAVGPVVGGTTICQVHHLVNTGPKPATVDWEASYPAEGFEVLVLASVYEEHDTSGQDVEAMVVKEWECSITSWVVDIESDNVPHGVYGVGLAISLDDITPSFQIYYECEAPNAPNGVVGWYYMAYPWGATPSVPIAQVPGITVNARTGVPFTGEKHFEIFIDCEYLCGAGATYYWAMQLKTNLLTWVGVYDWGADASGMLENHNGNTIGFPYTLAPYEDLKFNLAFNLDIDLLPDVYTITTTFLPASP